MRDNQAQRLGIPQAAGKPITHACTMYSSLTAIARQQDSHV